MAFSACLPYDTASCPAIKRPWPMKAVAKTGVSEENPMQRNVLFMFKTQLYNSIHRIRVAKLLRQLEFLIESNPIRIGPVTRRDKKTGEKLVNLWVNFAKTGNPTPKPDQPETPNLLDGFVWEPTKKHSRKSVLS